MHLTLPALILRSRVSGVSKDAPVRSGDIWSILRDAPVALLRMRARGIATLRNSR
jgi:hypothetical protein